jgi:hypothetical protein
MPVHTASAHVVVVVGWLPGEWVGAPPHAAFAALAAAAQSSHELQRYSWPDTT